MGVKQGASGHDELLALGRQPYVAGRALQQSITEAFFQAFELEADGGLGRVEGLGGTGETGEVGDPDEGLHGVDIQGFERISHIKSLSHIYRLISC